MLVFRFLKKARPWKAPSLVQMVVCAVLFSLLVYLWKLGGCLGYPGCSLCETLPADFFLSAPTANSTSDDFSRLMDLDDFAFLINNVPCNDSELLLVVLVHSDPRHFDKRFVIRRTWGSLSGERFKLLFLLGVTDDPAVQDQVVRENDENGDVIQGNFVDTYRNLTYKHVMALKWTKYFCGNARYLLKTDDDIFVNFPSFLEYLEGSLPETGLMRCLPVYEGRVKRTSRSKWRVTPAEYRFRTYPPFCQGFAILYSPDVASTLYGKAQLASYFWIDDVFITGILALSTNFTPSTFGRFMLEPEEFHRLMRADSEEFPYLLGPWNLREVDISKLWSRALRAGAARLGVEAAS